jgi:FixJ family two-component response regulator
MNTRNTYVAVVDDDESICRSFGRLLRAAGFQPITYPSAEAFLEDLKHPQFDCLVLDIQLSGMSGLELRDQLTAAGSVTPVIFITAYDDPDARTEALPSACAGYFRKADSGNLVLDAIRRAIATPDTTSGKPTGTGGAS